MAKSHKGRAGDLFEQLHKAQSGIEAIARIHEEMLSERTLEGCPEFCKSDYLAGNLLASVQLLAEQSYRDLSELEGLLLRDPKRGNVVAL